jgi:hypothetical protein
MDWLQIFVNLILTGILLYVFQRFIDERSSERLEKFKADIQTMILEKQTKFENLHEKRTEVVAELYRRLLQIRNLLYSVKSNIEAKKKEDEKSTYGAYLEIRTFYEYFDQNRLYLPETLCNKIGTFHRDLLGAHLALVSAEGNMMFASLNDPDAKKFSEEYAQDLQKFTSQMDQKTLPQIGEIEKEFRNLLGSNGNSQ